MVHCGIGTIFNTRWKNDCHYWQGRIDHRRFQVFTLITKIYCGNGTWWSCGHKSPMKTPLSLQTGTDQNYF